MMNVKVPSFTASQALDRPRAMRQAVGSGQPVTVAPPNPIDIEKIRAFMNSPAYRQWVAQFNAPALATRPLVQLDPVAARAVAGALGAVLPSVPVAKAKRRAPARPIAPAQSQPDPGWTEVAAVQRHEVVVQRSQIAKTSRVGTQIPPRAAAASGFTPQQTVMIGAAGGTMLGMGIAHLFNAIRHVDPSGAGSVLFALAGAIAGAGAGTLAGAKIVNPTGVTVPGFKISLKPV